MKPTRDFKLPIGILCLIVAQVICAVFFVSDVIDDYRLIGFTITHDWHLMIELAAALSLCAAIVFEVRYVLELLRRKAHLEHNLSVASRAMHDVIQAHFAAWGLTPAERDIATFMVKGLNIAEIAEMRNNAEGTVKSHLNAIYRKAGVRNRGEVLSLIIDTLMDSKPDHQA